MGKGRGADGEYHSGHRGMISHFACDRETKRGLLRKLLSCFRLDGKTNKESLKGVIYGNLALQSGGEADIIRNPVWRTELS